MDVDWIIAGSVLTIGVIDLLLVRFGARTLSQRMRRIGRRVSSLPFAFGAIAGHIWGPPGTPVGDSWALSMLMLAGITLSVGLVHSHIRKVFHPIPSWSILVYVIMGIPAGAFLWPQ